MQLFMRVYFILLCGFIFIQNGKAQSSDVPDGWKLFEKVKFKPTLMDDGEQYLLMPKFNDKIKAFEGKGVKLEGFAIPFEFENETLIVLSKFPYSSCFFCGAAGPDSVAEIHFDSGQPDLELDERVTIIGELQLNDNDIEHMNFILKGSKVVSK